MTTQRGEDPDLWAVWTRRVFDIVAPLVGLGLLILLRDERALWPVIVMLIFTPGSWRLDRQYRRLREAMRRADDQ